MTGIYQLDVGNIIYPNSTNSAPNSTNNAPSSTNNALVTVTQIQPIAVIFTLPQADLSEIQQQVAKGPMTVLAYSQDNKTLLGRGSLLLVNNEINQTTGTLQLKAVFPNKQSRLWPGQLVNVALTLDTLKNVTIVPAEAVQAGQQGQFVYVVKADKGVEMRPVTVGRTMEKSVVLDKGVAAGETVVTDGQLLLYPGAHVIPMAADKAETTGAKGL